MTETTVNVPLLRKVLDHITAHPEEHDQQSWGIKTSCGTAYCVAGHALAMSGVDFRWEYQLGAVRAIYTAEGEDVFEAGRQILGLDFEGADDLFESSNSLDVLWHLAKRYTDGEIQRPEVSG